MKSSVLFIPVLVALGISFSAVDVNASRDKDIRGIAPSKVKTYTPDSNGNWKCLDGSKSISFSAINDDYCDCLDGSDEPGTSACGSGYFYCHNKGHTPSYIKTSRLNDGVCDPECCDGSDEFDGQIACPNVCEEVGAEAKKERARIRSIQKEGSKIRKSYIKHGRNSKKVLQKQLDKLNKKSEIVQQKSTAAQAALDKAKSKQEAFMESTKAEREVARKIQLEPLIAEQNSRLKHHMDVTSLLLSTLEELKEKHNKNYHDLAVKSAITGYDEYLADIEERARTREEDAKVKAEAEAEKTEEEKKPVPPPTPEKQLREAQDLTYDARKDIGTLIYLLKTMKEDHNTEYNDVAVLKAIKVWDELAPTWSDEDNDFVGVKFIEMPDPIVPENLQYQGDNEDDMNQPMFDAIYSQVRKRAQSAGLGFLFRKIKSPLERAQESYNKASEEEREIQKEIEDVNRKMNVDYGKDESFAKLVDQCFEFKDREYTYSVCMFGEAVQKSGSSDTSLGKFSGWNGDNYDTQMYTGGMKCWNGPDRSVKMVLTCGAVNEIVAVSEPEKCQYLYKFRTPAVCAIVDENAETVEEDDLIPEPAMPIATSTMIPNPEQSTKSHDEL
ncbi:hypothetical protein BGZ83_009141 [Gryganskiella cystojenkinii]|nr:hypothetical protein BGZ83_009141 [Gryganskiella cystojenkinii]